jgi:ribonuclease HI
MAYKEMKFKDKRVHVEVDAAGDLVLVDGRAVMRYRPDDDRTYNPWPSNLTEPDAAPSAPPVRPARRVRARSLAPHEAPAPTPPDAVVAYTDGACLGNPGPAGLGYAVDFGDGRRVARGEPLGEGTNNIAELTAILRVLEIVTDRKRTLVVHTDSTYAIGVLTLDWKAKANQALISGIRKAMSMFWRIDLVKVKGHAGVPDNELVDDLARRAAQSQTNVEP